MCMCETCREHPQETSQRFWIFFQWGRKKSVLPVLSRLSTRPERILSLNVAFQMSFLHLLYPWILERQTQPLSLLYQTCCDSEGLKYTKSKSKTLSVPDVSCRVLSDNSPDPTTTVWWCCCSSGESVFVNERRKCCRSAWTLLSQDDCYCFSINDLSLLFIPLSHAPSLLLFLLLLLLRRSLSIARLISTWERAGRRSESVLKVNVFARSARRTGSRERQRKPDRCVCVCVCVCVCGLSADWALRQRASHFTVCGC